MSNELIISEVLVPPSSGTTDCLTDKAPSSRCNNCDPPSWTSDVEAHRTLPKGFTETVVDRPNELELLPEATRPADESRLPHSSLFGFPARFGGAPNPKLPVSRIHHDGDTQGKFREERTSRNRSSPLLLESCNLVA